MLNKIKKSPLILSFLSGLLLFVAWIPLPFFFLLFIAWIPVLFLIKLGLEESKSTIWFWKWSYLSMFIWNLGTTWWVWYASEGGAIAMLLANTFLMATVLTAVFYTRKHLPKSGYVSFVAYWIAFELLHLNWDLDFPWLTLGNGFAQFPILIQWYEYSGVLGGSFWILIVNIAIFRVLNNSKKYSVLKPILYLLLPIAFSTFIYFTYKPTTDSSKVEVLIVQPNIDPYTEKFEKDPYDLTTEMLDLIEENISPNTKFVFLPETAIPDFFEVSEWEDEAKIKLLYFFTRKHPNLAIITGLETYKSYDTVNDNCEKPTFTSRKSNQGDCNYYDVYNTSALIFKNNPPVYYHKSKLVLGVEKMPYPKYLGFLDKLSINLGGTSGSLGRSEEPVLFYGPDSISLCGLICYESIYGNYVREFANKGLDFISIITNDGWWKDTPGYKQHLYYGTLRAIETRKYIARSANTGISAVIDDRGVIRKRTSWWQEDVIKADILTNTKKTFYTKNGDLIGQACKFITIFMFLGTVVRSKTNK